MSKATYSPSYLRIHADKTIEEKIEKALHLLENCRVCPRNCGTHRKTNHDGFCHAGFLPVVSSYAPHFGEEKPLVGTNGSGTIFFTHCNLKCAFCQNYSISHLGEGHEVSFERLAGMMLELQGLGCHNINFVSPSHYVPQILKALPTAISNGLSIPLVYNTGGYDSIETLELLDGVIDIYMPDFKFIRSDVADDLMQAPDYPQIVKSALVEMHRQVGELTLDKNGIACRGLLVRHLVLPKRLAGTKKAMEFLTKKISPDTYVNIMAQYHPFGRISSSSPLSRRISSSEYKEALRSARTAGIHRLE